MMKVEMEIEVDPVRRRTPPYEFYGTVKIGNRTIYSSLVLARNLAQANAHMLNIFAARLERVLEDR